MYWERLSCPQSRIVLKGENVVYPSSLLSFHLRLRNSNDFFSSGGAETNVVSIIDFLSSNYSKISFVEELSSLPPHHSFFDRAKILTVHSHRKRVRIDAKCEKSRRLDTCKAFYLQVPIYWYLHIHTD